MIYILNRIFQGFFSLFGVASLVFFMFTILPGDPAEMMLDQNQNSEQLEVLKNKFGFDLPLIDQYLYYLNDLSPISYHSTDKNEFSYYEKEIYGGIPLFNFYKSIIVFKYPYLRTSYQRRGKPITDILCETLPNTAILAISSIMIAIFGGLFFGITATIFKDHWIDRFLLLFSTLGMSIPSFLVQSCSQWFFGYLLHSYTNLNMTGSLYELDDFGEITE